MPHRTLLPTIGMVPLILTATPARAQTLVVADSGDTAFVLVAGLVGLLTALPGLALMFLGDRPGDAAARHGGQTLTFAALGTVLLWVVIGYSLAFAPGGPWVGSAYNAMLGNMGTIYGPTTIEETAFAFAQLIPALVATALVAGLLFRRTSKGWLLGTIILWLLIVYLPLTRWSAAGWLADRGLEDYGAALPMVLAAGVSAATAAAILRMRTAPIDPPAGAAPASAPVNGASLATSGGVIMLARVAALALVLIGWCAILGAAGLGAGPIAAGAMLAALTAAAAGAFTAWVAGGRRASADDALSTIGRGMLGGLAAVTGGAGLIGLGGAALLGAIGALFATHGTRTLHRWLGDATMAGALGTLALPVMVGLVLMVPLMAGSLGGAGLTEGTSAAGQIVAQLTGIGVASLWAIIGTLIAGLAMAVVRPPQAG